MPTQRKLEALSGVDQSQISRILSFEELAKKAQRPRGLNRIHLLALSVRGLKLSCYQASLLLWLAEAERYRFWSPEEFKKAGVKKPDAKTIRKGSALHISPIATFEAVLELLREIFRLDILDNDWNKIETEVLHGNAPASRIALFEVLKEMEKRPGQRMLVSKYPSIMVSTDIANSSETVRNFRGPERAELLEQLRNRQTTFHMRLSKYGERVIHSIPSLERFVSKSFAHPVPVEERKKRVAGLIKYLDKYSPKFQVGLSDREPEVEIAIKSTESVVVRGTSRDLSNHPDTIVCGPSYLYWDDILAVITFYVDFEQEWLKLHRNGRTDKDVVTDVLRKLIA